MMWPKWVIPAVLLLWVFAVPAAAQLAGHPIEVSAGGGIFSHDTRARLKDGAALVGSAGYRFAPWLTIELGALYNSANSDTTPVAKASADLSTALENKDTPAEDIAKKLAALREARDKARADLVAVQKELKDVLTQRQEAVLVTMGMLE